MEKTTFDKLDPQQKAALSAAKKVMGNSYSPYSGFMVGAALYGNLLKEVVTGTNFENASYGLTICAERVAISNANTIGARNFRGIAIIGKGKKFDTKKITGPCGACRQVLLELAQASGHDLEVILSTTNMDEIGIASIDELLPFSFGPDDLKV